MRPMGFSTGALALADFSKALAMMASLDALRAVELSALRSPELAPLVDALPSLDLSRYEYVAVHAPSAFSADAEAGIVGLLGEVAARGWTIVVHPDAIRDWSIWRVFGSQLCIENMDKRKPFGRTVEELAACFDRAPEASLCLDLGHARQVDPSMSTAFAIMRAYGNRLRHIHLSEVATDSSHNRISYTASLAFQRVAALVPEAVPIILETPLGVGELDIEVKRARLALTPSHPSREANQDTRSVAV